MIVAFAKARVMLAETARLTGLMLDFRHVRVSWKMQGTGLTGYKYRYVTMSNGITMEDDTGQHIMVPRDRYDQVCDFVADWLSTFHRNVWVESRCGHPHESVIIEWDGDREDGYWSQHRCDRCRGYTCAKEVDRFLPADQRHPEKVRDPYRPAALDQPPYLDKDDDEGSCYDPDYDYISRY